MKRNKGLVAVTVILCLLILGSMFFPLLKLDLSSVMDGTVPFAQQLQGVSGKLGSSGEEMMLEVTGKEVLSSLGKETSDLGSAGKELMLQVRMLVLIPCISALLLLLLGFFKGLWASIVSLILSAAGILSAGLGLAWYLPSRLSTMIADQAGDTVSAVVTRITESEGAGAAEAAEEIAVKASDIRKLILQGATPALWAVCAAFLLLLIVSVFRICLRKDADAASGNSTFSQPSFRCSDGPLAGETIPLGEKDEITFGSDPSYANMVIERSEIAPLHCRISYSQEKEKYMVQVFDNAPVLLKGKELGSGENALRRGSEIFLGSGGCSILLL